MRHYLILPPVLQVDNNGLKSIMNDLQFVLTKVTNNGQVYFSAVTILSLLSWDQLETT